VVDDTAINRKVLMTQLQTCEVRSEDAPNGPDALQFLRKASDAGDPFQLAILDMQMPGMDGATLAQAIKTDEKLKDIPLVLFSAMGDRGEVGQLQKMGFAAYLPKPAERSEILNCLSLAMADQAITPQAPLRDARHRKRDTQNLFAGRKARILLAEDNIINQQVATAILMKLGLRADAVANGAEAVTVLETIPYDVVLMDVQMPEMDGLEATRRIRQMGTLNQQVPIIAMTAHAMQGDREKCLKAGMNGYVTKPVTPQALAEALEKWLPPDTAA
jgi:CheY-like chemotaxis protein